MKYNEDMIVGTAGHIDHGKTTLLKALTGIDADRLEEEKRRGISIDIGFAHMDLGPYRIGFIDVPGHEKFVKNMLVGVGGIQLVLLVVAADESIMPQTVEHFQICKLLEIPRGIIVITKKTQVEEELLPLVEAEARELVKGSRLETAPLVLVDSVSGEGVETLRQTLLQQVEEAESEKLKHDRPDGRDRIFRLPIDRVFSIRGFGTVVTGTPYAGSLRKEDAITVYPSGKTAKVRGIEIFGEQTDAAKAGQRTALNLSGIEKEDLERGMTISTSSLFRPSHMVDATVHLLPTAPGPLKHRSPIRFHHGSAELMGRLYLLDTDQLSPGQSTLAQVRLETPIMCCPKDHFVLRRYSPITTIGGGIVIDGKPDKHRKRELGRLLPDLEKLRSMLERGDAHIDGALLDYFVKSHGYTGASLPELVSRTGFLPEHLLDLAKDRNPLVVLSRDPLHTVFKPTLEELQRHIVQFLTEFHSRNPLVQGIPQEELKERFLKKASTSYFHSVLKLLEDENQIKTAGGAVSLPGKQARLDAEQEKVKSDILNVLKKQGFQPPTLDELIKTLSQDPGRIRDVYYFLLQQGDLIRVSEEFVLSAEQLSLLQEQLKKFCPSGQTFTVPEFKNLFKISRKYAIPFLEYLDRQRVTRRMGDKRVVL